MDIASYNFTEHGELSPQAAATYDVRRVETGRVAGGFQVLADLHLVWDNHFLFSHRPAGDSRDGGERAL